MTVKAESTVFQTAIAPLPLVVGGKGVYVDVEDPLTGEVKTLLDGNSGAAVCAVGHDDDEIKEKIIEAVKTTLTYNFPLLTGNKPSEELAKFLVDNSPPGAFETATFTGSGSEANENAMKIVRKYHIENGDLKKVKFISRKQSYHGFTLGALSISDNLRKLEYEEIILPASITPKVSQCYPYRLLGKGETLEQYKDRLLKEVEDTFIAEGPETIAAFIAETVTGSTFGCSLPIPGYLDGVRDICHKYGALFYLDEVMCGIGRMGTFHAWEQFLEGPGPDIQTNGKTLGSGYSTIASILISPKIMNVFKKKNAQISGAQTYHSNAFNCQVALEVQKKVKRDGLIQNIYDVGNYFGKLLATKLASSKTIGDVRGRGGFWAIEFVEDKDTKEPFDPSVGYSKQFAKRLFANGAFSLPGTGTIDGKLGEHAIFSPAFSITKDEAEQLVNIIVKTVDDIEKANGL